MDHIDIEEQISVKLGDCKGVVVDSESDSSSSSSDRFGDFARNGLIKLEEGSSEHDMVKRSLIMGMREFVFAQETNVVAIHRNSHSGLRGESRFEAFRIFSDAVAKKCGGNANIKFAWYGASRNEISAILSHGFSHCTQPEDPDLYGLGVYLYPAKSSINGCLSSVVDESGLRHMLLCRVILGKSEEICAGSKQFQPSSVDFDSGVDNISEPRKYIIWSCYMNTHILPSYIISFKAPSSIGLRRNEEALRKPTSPFMRFPNLMSMLAKYLGPSEMGLITKHYYNFRENKISRSQLIQKMRHIAGDHLLAAVIKSCKNSEPEARTGRSSAASYSISRRRHT